MALNGEDGKESSWRCITQAKAHNIRAQPRLDAEVVGEIQPGETVVGHLTSDVDWLQLSGGFSLFKSGSTMFFARGDECQMCQEECQAEWLHECEDECYDECEDRHCGDMPEGE